MAVVSWDPVRDGSFSERAVVSGRFRLTLEGESVVLEAGDAIEVPNGALHSAEVVGEEPVVSLDALRR